MILPFIVNHTLTVVITVPFMVGFHAVPYDYGRYTEFYWKERLTQTGFDVLKIEKQGLYWSVLADMFREYVHCKIIKKNQVKSLIFRFLLYKIAAWARTKAVELDSFPDNETHLLYSRYTTGFAIIAQKSDL